MTWFDRLARAVFGAAIVPACTTPATLAPRGLCVLCVREKWRGWRSPWQHVRVVRSRRVAFAAAAVLNDTPWHSDQWTVWAWGVHDAQACAQPAAFLTAPDETILATAWAAHQQAGTIPPSSDWPDLTPERLAQTLARLRARARTAADAPAAQQSGD